MVKTPGNPDYGTARLRSSQVSFEHPVFLFRYVLHPGVFVDTVVVRPFREPLAPDTFQTLRDFLQRPVLRLKAECQEFLRVLLLGEILAKLVHRVSLFARLHLIRAQVIRGRWWCGVCHWGGLGKSKAATRCVARGTGKTSKAQPRVKKASGGDAQVREPGVASFNQTTAPTGEANLLRRHPLTRP